MRLHHRWFSVLVIALAVTAAPRVARAVQVATGTGSGIGGDLVDITLSTGNLTGLNIRSLQFSMSYNANYVTAVDVLESGTAVGAAGWGDATFNVTSSAVSVSHAGSAALTGAGPLIRIRFLINPAQLNAANTTLTLSNFVFNEGVPNDTTSNGSITISATPIITVSPNTGDVIRTQTLQFNVSGSVTNPVTWGTTDGTLATISASGLLTGVAPGTVRVFAVDNAGRRDTTDNAVTIYGMGLAAGSKSVVQGQTVVVPFNVTSLDGLGIRSGQFRVAYDSARVKPVSLNTGINTLLQNYGPATMGDNGTFLIVDFVGSTDLGGTGPLCTITFRASTLNSGGSGLVLSNAIFNENLPAKTTNGTLTVTGLPGISVTPDQISLLAGQNQTFTATGATPPVVWSVEDPTLATINSNGILTAVKGGVTRVRAVDALGAIDYSTALTIDDFRATLGTVAGPPGATVLVPITSDRVLGALDIRSLQYGVTFNPTWITAARASTGGLISVWGAANVEDDVPGGRINVAAAGVNPMPGTGTVLHQIEFDIAPGAAPGTNIPITLVSFMCNEGSPRALIVNGTIQVRTTADAPAPGGLLLELARCEPNPVRAGARFRFTVPAAAATLDLGIFDLGGRRLRTLASGALAAGEHDVAWDGRDEHGQSLAAGLYFYRLSWQGRTLSRKLVVTR